MVTLWNEGKIVAQFGAIAADYDHEEGIEIMTDDNENVLDEYENYDELTIQ